MEAESRITHDISTSTIFRALLVVFFAYLVFQLKGFFLIVLTSIVIASAVERATQVFLRWRVPRVWAVLIIYAAAFSIVFGVLSVFLPPLFADLSDLSADLPGQITALGGAGVMLDPISSLTGGLAHSLSIQDIVVDLQKFLLRISDSAFSTASIFLGGFFSAIMILVISFYLSVQERGIENFLRIITPLKNERYVLDLWRRTQNKIGLWFQGQLILGLIIGLIVFVMLSVLNIKYALTLAILAALFEIIPFFGPILSAIPAILLALADGPLVGLIVLILYIIVQQLENNVIYPLVVKKIIGVSPLVAILALLVGGQLAGFLGLIIAIPLATFLMEMADDLEKRKHSRQLEAPLP